MIFSIWFLSWLLFELLASYVFMKVLYGKWYFVDVSAFREAMHILWKRLICVCTCSHCAWGCETFQNAFFKNIYLIASKVFVGIFTIFFTYAKIEYKLNNNKLFDCFAQMLCINESRGEHFSLLQWIRIKEYSYFCCKVF